MVFGMNQLRIRSDYLRKDVVRWEVRGLPHQLAIFTNCAGFAITLVFA